MSKGIVEDLRRAIRKAERGGATRYRIAKNAGMKQTQVDRIASGERTPTLPVAERLAKGLGLRLVLVPIVAK